MTPRNPLYGSLPNRTVRLSRDPRDLRLPAPPSVNECYRNPTPKEAARGVKGRIRTKVYNDWRDVAEQWLCVQKFTAIGSPVSVTIYVGQCSQARDLDNFAKPVLDILVRCGVLRNDNLKNVHEVRLIRAFETVTEGVVSVWVEPAVSLPQRRECA